MFILLNKNDYALFGVLLSLMLQFQCQIVLTCSYHPYRAYISNAIYSYTHGFAFGLVLMLRKLKLRSLLLDAGVTLRADRFYILSFSVIDTLLWSPGSDY